MIDDNVMKGLFLLIIAVSGNFIAETMGCQTQRLLGNNMYAKHIVVLTTIYFCISYTDNIDPFLNLKNSLYIYIGFIVFTKMDLNSTCICFILLLLMYVMQNFRQYYKKNNNIDMMNKINNIEYYIEKAIYIVLIVGFMNYLNEQKESHKDDFEINKFLFGVLECEKK